jgi:hypothetical protein
VKLALSLTGTEGSNPSPSSAESATNLVTAGCVARGWDPEFESALLQRGGSNEPLWLPGASHAGGTQSSNPLCSSGESRANLTSHHRALAIFAGDRGFESISLQGRVQYELPRTNFETKSAQTIPPPDRQSM